LDNLSFGFIRTQSQPPDLTSGWDVFPNLQDLTINGDLKVAEVQALLKSPKLYLENINLESLQ